MTEIDKKRWPAWCNGPDGETEIFNSPSELPPGWYHPKLSDKPKKAKAEKPQPIDL